VALLILGIAAPNLFLAWLSCVAPGATFLTFFGVPAFGLTLLSFCCLIMLIGYRAWISVLLSNFLALGLASAVFAAPFRMRLIAGDVLARVDQAQTFPIQAGSFRVLGAVAMDGGIAYDLGDEQLLFHLQDPRSPLTVGAAWDSRDLGGGWHWVQMD
jgi:hypothetical protein